MYIWSLHTIIGYLDDAQTLFTRSQQYPVIYDSNLKFFRSKSNLVSDKAFDEFAWGDPYTEGSCMCSVSVL